MRSNSLWFLATQKALFNTKHEMADRFINLGCIKMPSLRVSHAAVSSLAAMLLCICCSCSSMASTPPDKSSDYASQLYMHSFDDVYQATAEAIERKGWFIDSADKSAGTYVFSEKNGFNFTAVVKIEPINSSGSPQARVRFNYIKKPGGLGGLEFRSRYPKMFFTELQKILATYR